ncbi:2OG-Fe(II) oxygenase [Orpheovirus IHUMI-LCC2]|uniref:2OG-Fe(II) oxygenase n=1 Tax=Orpheovirus IHUMI-LCC2 TaxID=2023057 RepID=A0A2I2L521_9VIRU|nr:2OG-Fe(II) oxygenase [Orpheovirus IHUMI-LCC2]SNW62616.1 2OG-Fe(II) oxygenase [Orpheovirus IHUMI-LCC2]
MILTNYQILNYNYIKLSIIYNRSYIIRIELTYIRTMENLTTIYKLYKQTTPVVPKSELVDIKENTCWKDSTVGYNGDNIINTEVRNSKWAKYYDDIKLDKPIKNNLNIILGPDCEYDDWTLLKYETGCKFTKHKDGVKNGKHAGTLLVIFPKSYSDYTGGELVIYKDQEEVIVRGYDDNYCVVFLGIDLDHEVKEVLSGTRYCLKTPVFSDISLQLPPPPVDGNIRRLSFKKEVDEVDEKIRKLQEEKKKYEGEYEELRKEIKKFVEGNDMIALRGLYKNYEEMTDTDKLICEEFMKVYPSCQLLNVKVEVEDDSECDTGVYRADDKDYCEVALYYDRRDMTEQVLNTRSEYNDQGYDDYDDILVTCIRDISSFEDYNEDDNEDDDQE